MRDDSLRTVARVARQLPVVHRRRTGSSGYLASDVASRLAPWLRHRSDSTTSAEPPLSNFNSYRNIRRSRLLVVSEVLTMRFHPTGLIVFVGFLLLALVGGAGPAVAVVRVAVAIFFVAAAVEVVVNMVRHRNLRVQSRLLGLLGEQSSFAARM